MRALADREAIAAFDLEPQSDDPVARLATRYVITRAALERLPNLDPARRVAIANSEGYTYTLTPRTVLRRILDHTLDHLNQVEQWVAWQATGLMPAPTDGWASSADDLDEDTLPLTRTDLNAWLWRIDLVMMMLRDRAARLTPAELDWMPPDGGWTLRRVLHHVARGFYAAWLDDPLPEISVARYIAASQRLVSRLAAALEAPTTPGQVYFGSEGRVTTLAAIIEDVLTARARLLAPTG